VRKLTPVAYAAAVLIGLVYGFDVGERISGILMGVIMALNTAVFGVLCVSAVAGWLLQRVSRPGGRD
jgi:ABC-type transporter Mla maintaining outer membrane lipid asymmetry permease subunit MlaE